MQWKIKSKLKVLSCKWLIYETLVESIRHIPAYTPPCLFWWRASHQIEIIIPALYAGFKMCQWRVIVTVIDVITQPGVFYNASILSAALLTIGMCPARYATYVAVHVNTGFHFCFPVLFHDIYTSIEMKNPQRLQLLTVNCVFFR